MFSEFVSGGGATEEINAVLAVLAAVPAELAVAVIVTTPRGTFTPATVPEGFVQVTVRLGTETEQVQPFTDGADMFE